MKGRYTIQIEDNRLCYKFDITRNITLIQGDSATGKTKLIRMIRDHARGNKSIHLIINTWSTAEKLPEIRVIASDDDLWEYRIQTAHNTIFFLDEDCTFVKTQKFASVVKNADCYFVIINRNRLSMLPYSLEEVYEIAEDKKYPKLKKTYNKFVRKYGDNQEKIVPDVILTEDSNSDYQFAKAAFSCNKIMPCNGKDNVATLISENTENKIIAIVDGAAFGPEIEDVAAQKRIRALSNKQTVIFAPESFEWCILRSRLFYDKCKKQLDETYNYADSKEYGSWEQYYTDLLIELTRNTPAAYTKSNLNEFYLGDNSIKAIKEIYDCIDEGLADMSLF